MYGLTEAYFIFGVDIVSEFSQSSPKLQVYEQSATEGLRLTVANFLKSISESS